MNEVLGVFDLGIPIIHFLFVLLVIFVIFCICYIKQGQIYKGQLLILLFVIYIYVLAGSTIVYRDSWYLSLNWVRRYEMIPFRSYYEAITKKQYILMLQCLLNVILFIPFGLLLNAILNPKSMARIVTFAFLLSSVIEILQAFAHRGLCEMDDIIHNTVGSWLGCLLIKKITILWK